MDNIKVVNTLKKLAQKYTVLYVEDDYELRKNTSELLDYLFSKVIVAENGTEALLKYSTHYNSTEKYPDIVISDINMPNMDGVELSREITQVNKNQKIIIVSAYSDKKYFIDLIKIGVSGFMEKPLSSSKTFEILYEMCLELDRDIAESRYIQLIDGFRWDRELNILRRGPNKVELTSNEISVFAMFIKSKERIFSDLEIFNQVDNKDSEFSSNAVKSLIKRLRKKIPDGLIKTHKNMGYSLKLL